MAILIDGYNLLHVTGIIGRGLGHGTLQRSRNALLGYLATSLDEEERSITTVVFDAHNAPPGLPREYQQQGIRVKYAVGYADADALLEELIKSDSAPRQLTVVSSDHRVQRAAKRRRARAVDSDVWFDALGQRRSRAEPDARDNSAKPAGRLTQPEVAAWLELFGNAPADEAPAWEQNGIVGPDSGLGELANPFPPGYAEDLLDE